MNEIALDNTILVSCPERDFQLRMIKHCLDCDYYKGIVKAGSGETESIEQNHHVLCGRPMTRSLIKMSAD